MGGPIIAESKINFASGARKILTGERWPGRSSPLL
jgi:hypothetical protein